MLAILDDNLLLQKRKIRQSRCIWFKSNLFWFFFLVSIM